MATKNKPTAAKQQDPGWRQKPKTPYWSHTMIREAKLFKEFTGSVNLAIFSSTESVRANARLHSTRKDWSQVKLPQGKVDFSIGARAFIRDAKAWG